jgi:hypothetical protein
MSKETRKWLKECQEMLNKQMRGEWPPKSSMPDEMKSSEVTDFSDIDYFEDLTKSDKQLGVKMSKVHGELKYTKENGESVHSDICPRGCDLENLDEDHRQFLHACLDEWLDKSRGTGAFYIESAWF